MKRLFLAFKLPEPIQVLLTRFQAAAPPGCRLTQKESMHLTLVFLGQAEPEQVSSALRDLTYQAPWLTLEKPGCFSSGDQLAFWISIEANAALLSLHTQLLDRLRSQGLEPDEKPFEPHITLARCKDKPSPIEKAQFLGQQLPEDNKRFLPQDLTLYSSITLPSGPVYQVESVHRAIIR